MDTEFSFPISGTLSIYVIGCGGIGGYLLNLLPQTLACLNLDVTRHTFGDERFRRIMNSEGQSNELLNYFSNLVLIDGDTYSGHNALRQDGTVGSKVAHQVSKMRNSDAMSVWLANTSLVGYNTYITPEKMKTIFGVNGTNRWRKVIVFLCVDNHKTRYEVTRFLEDNFSNFLIINGGNSKYTGNVTVQERSNGQDKDPSLYKVYPEINDKTDKRPDEVACGTVAPENDQTAITNNMIASVMLSMFSKWYRTGGFEQKTRRKDENGNNITVRKNEVIIDFENFSMQSLSHGVSLDNRNLSVLEGPGQENFI